jgi:hypothetical protein
MRHAVEAEGLRVRGPMRDEIAGPDDEAPVSP